MDESREAFSPWMLMLIKQSVQVPSYGVISRSAEATPCAGLHPRCVPSSRCSTLTTKTTSNIRPVRDTKGLNSQCATKRLRSCAQSLSLFAFFGGEWALPVKPSEAGKVGNGDLKLLGEAYAISRYLRLQVSVVSTCFQT